MHACLHEPQLLVMVALLMLPWSAEALGYTHQQGFAICSEANVEGLHHVELLISLLVSNVKNQGSDIERTGCEDS